MTQQRLPLFVGALISLCATLNANAAIVLSETSTFADIAISGAGCQPPSLCTTENEGPVFARVQIGSTFAQADAQAGVIRALTEATGDASGTASGAGTGATVEVKLLNTGNSPVVLPAGALVFNVDSLFLRTVGVISGTTVAASLAYGSDITNTSSATFQYQYFEVAVPGSGTVNVTQSAIGGAAIQVRTATPGVLDLTFSSGALSVQPGDELTATFLFQPTVVAAGAGSYAQIDTTQTAAFGLQLPAGVDFDANGLNVAWVSVVPEIPTSAMIGLGVGVIALAKRRRKQIH